MTRHGQGDTVIVTATTIIGTATETITLRAGMRLEVLAVREEDDCIKVLGGGKESSVWIPARLVRATK